MSFAVVLTFLSPTEWSVEAIPAALARINHDLLTQPQRGFWTIEVGSQNKFSHGASTGHRQVGGAAEDVELSKGALVSSYVVFDRFMD